MISLRLLSNVSRKLVLNNSLSRLPTVQEKLFETEDSHIFLRGLGTSVPKLKKQKVSVTFVKPNGEKITSTGKEGDSLLDIVVNQNIDIDGFGACEGTLACSTCHLILKQVDYDKVQKKPSDEEMDMLDLAFELSDTSRLGCQVIMTKELDGLEVNVPDTINDARQT